MISRQVGLMLDQSADGLVDGGDLFTQLVRDSDHGATRSGWSAGLEHAARTGGRASLPGQRS
jgi:hypothetical protein